jgi:hypothetical protein
MRWSAGAWTPGTIGEARIEGLARLAVDLSDGTWHRKYSGLMEREAMDLGYRLVVGNRTPK